MLIYYTLLKFKCNIRILLLISKVEKNFKKSNLLKKNNLAYLNLKIIFLFLNQDS
jgi:hypothetical protein